MAGYLRTTAHKCPPPISLVNYTGVSPAPGITFHTAKVRINSKAWGTEFTERLVIFHVARSVAGAAVGGAGVDALVGDARPAGGASVVLQADGDGRHTVLDADADGAVVEDVALLVGRTGPSDGAGVGASVSDAGQVAGALLVLPTLDWSCRTHKLTH